MNFQKKMYPAYFLFGALALYVFLYVFPSLVGIYYSFTDWSRFDDAIRFIGWDNYKAIFSADENYLFYIGNTLKLTVVTTILKTVLGLALALIVGRSLWGKNFHRAVIFLPSVLSFLITGLTFQSILSPSGLLNSFLRTLGLDGWTRNWLYEGDWPFWSIYGIDVWKGMGYIMTIFLAGLMTISKEYYEAADIDGAHFWGKFRYITLPLLLPSFAVTTVLNLVYGLRVFDIVYVLTQGGPGDQTDVLYTVIFKLFGYGYYGLGTALSSLMFVIMVVIGYFIIRLLNKEVEA
ncbi:ABC transporter permease [Paenibacillus sp. 598K]|uniref:carbohydrate ABC transporter permease n=1 Tax=Paenibacillus sp. 598K TaxID=1117987 RepID=UPI000FFA3521|nr:sugar ABC transporter permease [Paenibacillus sp. 598K]GBF74380.1 ABC transporter permease [Paenibacillus sp. 598K]